MTLAIIQRIVLRAIRPNRSKFVEVKGTTYSCTNYVLKVNAQFFNIYTEGFVCCAVAVFSLKYDAFKLMYVTM